MKKFRFLTIYNLRKAIFTKGFVISNIFLLILTVVLINIPNIINRFSPSEEELNVVVYYDLEHQNHEDIHTYLINSVDGYEEYGLTYNMIDGGVITVLSQTMIDEFKESENDVLIYFENTNDLDLLKAQIHYNKGSNQSKLILEEIITQTRNVILGIELKRVEITKFEIDQEEVLNKTMLLSQIISIPMFMIILRALALIGVDIVQEKSSKAIETIISSVPVKTHFISKVTASLGFVFVQTVLLLFYGFIGGLISSSSGVGSASELINISQAELTSFLGIAIVFTIVTSIFYLVVGGLLAAMANSQEDYQVVQGPLTLLLIFGFYLNIFLPMAGKTGVGILKVFAFIPPLSGFAAPVAFALGAMLWWEVLISILMFVVVLGIIFYFFGPVYRLSILSYEKTKFRTRFVSNIKKARVERKTKK